MPFPMNDAVSLDATRSTVPLPSETVVGGRFQIQSFVGPEAGTEVYQALDTRDNAQVVLRLFPCPTPAKPVVEGDLSHATEVKHKNLAALIAWGYEGDRVYVATEASDGATLKQIIASRRSQNQVVGLAHAHVLLGHAANALEASYPALSHGGINPGAIRLTDAGRIKVHYLGLTRALPALARDGVADVSKASPYMAPEVSAGAAPSPPADVFSLTAVLYELITGHAPSAPPWPATQVNPELPKGIDKVIDRGLASLPETRFGRPSQLIAEVGALLAGTAPGKQDKVASPPRLTLGKSFSVSDAVRISEEYERWLIQKDSLDFGPFSLAQVMSQMEKGVFTGEHFIVDADSGDRQKIKDHPQLAEFARVVERKLEAQRRTRAEQAHEHTERRKGRWTIAIIGLAVLAVAGGLTFYLMNRKAAENDVLASRVSEADIDKFLNGVKVEFAQPKQSGGGGGRRRASSGGGGPTGRAEDFSNLMDYGDVSKDGGDAILDDGTVDRIMRGNYRKLVPCAMQGGIRTVELDFVIHPSGRVKAVQVNGQRSGGMANCIMNQMQSFGWPQYRGKNTIASWSMSFR
jgi:eukaryotic-like serine/threonine-protein kinase